MEKTIHAYRDYVFTIEDQPRDPAYIVDFPDIPSIITRGSTLPEAFAHACEALDLHLESLQKLELPWPVPKHRLFVETSSSS